MPKTQKKVKRTKVTPYAKPKKAPAAVSQKVTTKSPVLRHSPGSCTIVHSELFASVIPTAVGFTTRTYAINPGEAALFPWLATQSWGWERYRFKKLVVRFVTRSPTTMIGNLVLSPDYDAADGAPANEVAACSYADAVSEVPWQSFSMSLKRERLLGGATSKYIRAGVLASNLDIKTYDGGNLFVCMDASVANQTWGKLWVDYEVELLTPHTLPTPSASVYSNKYVAGGGFNPAQPWFGLAPGAATAATAGPLKLTPTSYPAANGNNMTISGLTPGQLYRIMVEGAAAPSKTVSSTVYSSLVNLVETLPILTTMSAASGSKGILLDSIMQATDTIASLSTIFTGTDGVSFLGANMSVTPVGSGTSAYTAWY